MFNFHKPKVYRSTTGCCICKAKSSSSRFTDSKKYEEDFIKCFELVEPRKGEICNACVLLVKRFKKLPPGSDRNWKHVVDARAGPGMKSMSKFKSKSKKLKEEQEKRKKKHHHHHHHSHSQQVPSHPSTSNGLATGDHNHNHEDHLHRLDREGSPVGSDGSLDGNDDALMAEVDDAFMMCDEENQSGDSSSRTPSPGASDSEDTVPEERGRRRKTKPVKRPSRAPDHSMEESDFIDTEYFKKVMTCCGPVYRGLMGETMTTMVDVRFYKPCKARLNMLAQRRMEIATCAPPLVSPTGAVPSLPSPDSTGISDSSSDSGYDDSSNPGATLLAAVVPTSPSKAAGAATARATDSAFVDGNKKVCTTDCLVVGQISDDVKITNN